MASTLIKVRNALRYRLGAFSNSNISTPELNEIIQSNCRYLSGQVPLGEKWVLSAVTVLVNTNSIALPAGLEYSDILEVRRSSDSWVLTKRTREEMTKLFWPSSTVTASATGDPNDYCLVEDEAQGVTLYFNIKAGVATPLDVCRRVLPTDLTLDAGAIPFSTLALEALIDLSAVELITRLPEKSLAELNINPAVTGFWMGRAEKNIKSETERLHRQRGVGRPLRFVG